MDGKKPYVVVAVIQLIYTGLYVMSKAAFNEGMSTFVFIFYRQAAATVLLTPLAIVFERKNVPSLSLLVIFKMFMLSLFGYEFGSFCNYIVSLYYFNDFCTNFFGYYSITFSLNVNNIGLKYTSATVASATSNSLPVITFFLALLLRMESVKLKSISGMVKVFGVGLCLSGILTMAFYTGPHLNPLNNHHLIHHKTSYHDHTPTHSKATWIKGTFLLFTSNTTWSLWFVFQGMLLKEYSSKLLLTTFQCLFSTVQTFFVALAFERKISRWYLHMDIGLLAIAYCGFVATGISFYLQAWCIEKKGPVFLAMSKPLVLVFTIILSSIFLGEVTHLGSVLGGIMMVGGLYGVLWGKSKETVKCEPTIEDGNECYDEREIAPPCRPL